MLQGLINSLEEEEQHAMEEALTSSPIASHLLDFSADDAADLFAEALLSTSTDDVSSSHPAVIATTSAAAMDPSIPSCSYNDTSFASAALAMDPATLSSLLDVKTSDPDPEEFIQTISSNSIGYPEDTLHVIQQDQFDQIATDGFSTAVYPASAMLQPPAYEEECLIPAGLTCYVGIEPTVAANSCSFVDPGNDGMMYQGGMNLNAVCGRGGVEGQGGFFPTMIGSIEPGMGLQEMAEYQNRPSAVAMGVYYGMEPLQHAYNTSPPELQVFGDRQQQVCTSSSPASVADLPSLDDSTFKVGRISAEERKEKIHRYMKKRNERNFSKKIKYACRKTLADSRPRVRGRFAKNEDSGETTRPRSSHNEYDDDEEVVVKEEDLFDPSDILAHISGVNSFKYNYTVESWI